MKGREEALGAWQGGTGGVAGGTGGVAGGCSFEVVLEN